MKVNQFTFDFTFNSLAPKFIRTPPPSQVRIIARRHRLSIPMATVVCREAGIGGSEAQ